MAIGDDNDTARLELLFHGGLSFERVSVVDGPDVCRLVTTDGFPESGWHEDFRKAIDEWSGADQGGK